ncbi:MAG: hypothetical protein AAFP80_02530 [Pseudomonadota bacterium]
MVSNGTRTLVWDAQNKLASVTPLGGGQAVTFQYGPDGSRIAKLSSFTPSRHFANANYLPGAAAHQWLRRDGTTTVL